ncbi:MAG: zinc ABC transporter substrate-binding protein [Sphingobacteriia bacterium]|nr:zinc ABC transporter substrate-binding protein [Sphingobacteriia bacterium]
MKKLFSIILVFLISYNHALAKDKLNVVTTLSAISAITEDILGNTADVTNIMPEGSSHHHYSFSPKNIEVVKNADLFIYLDENFEVGIDKLKASNSLKLMQIKDLKILPNKDFHIWLDVENTIKIAKKIKEEGIKLLPNYQTEITSNYNKLRINLLTIDAQIKKELQSLQNYKAIILHNSLNYFTNRYNLQALIDLDLHSETSLSPKVLEEINQYQTNNNLRCIFYDNPHNLPTAKNLSKKLNLPIIQLDTEILKLENSYETGQKYAIILLKIKDSFKRCFGNGL